MKTATATSLHDYFDLLSSRGVFVRSDDAVWLSSGILHTDPPLRIAVSSTIAQAPQLLTQLTSTFKTCISSFRLIKNRHLHYQLNGGAFGADQGGRFLEFYPASQYDAARLISKLLAATAGFCGPVVFGYRHVGNNIFINRTIAYEPVVSQLSRQSQLIARKYLPVQLVHNPVKGPVQIALNVKKFRWCVIKHGYRYMCEDDHGRNVRDRLLWEKQVLLDLHGKAPVPAALDFFEDGEGSNLVLQFINGKSFYKVVTASFKSRKWNTLSKSQKARTLRYYLEAVQIIECLHQNGYVHRDVNPFNFIIRPSGKLTIIDFEISYNLSALQPAPPFVLGKPGYISPEQQQVLLPTVKEDIYSLGALLIFMVTGVEPDQFLGDQPELMRDNLAYAGVPSGIVGVIDRCLCFEPTSRPTLQQIHTTIRSLINQL